MPGPDLRAPQPRSVRGHARQWADARSHRRQRLLHVLRLGRPHHQRGHPVRRAQRPGHGRRRRRARGRVPAPARRHPPILGAHRALPGQHVGAAQAGGAAGLRPVRRRQPEPRRTVPAPWWCPTSWWTAPAAAPTRTSTPAPSTSTSPTRTAPTCGPRPPRLPGVVDGGTMVVIQGPRFSTRAESRWFASAGFGLVNMTGYPEAVLARELEICYAAIALVTDLDAGIEAGDGREGRRRVRRIRKEHRSRSRSWCARRSAGSPPNARARTACRTPASPCPWSCREGVADRGGRFHRVAGGRGAAGGGSRRGRRRRAAARRARPGSRCCRQGCHRVDVRDADALAPLLDGVDLVCHQAAMVGAGVDAADAPAYGGHNDFATTVLLAQMFAAGVRRLVLASSMVVYGQGRYHCARARATSTRCRGGAPTSTPGISSTAARSVAKSCSGASSTRMPRCGRAACTRPARPRRSITRWRGRSRRAARWWRCATTTSTVPGCRATPRIPGWRRSSARHWKRRAAKGFRGRRSDA